MFHNLLECGIENFNSEKMETFWVGGSDAVLTFNKEKECYIFRSVFIAAIIRFYGLHDVNYLRDNKATIKGDNLEFSINP